MLIIHTRKIANLYDYKKWHWTIIRNIQPELELWKYKLFLKYLERKYKNTYLINKCIDRIKKDYPNKEVIIKDIIKGQYYWEKNKNVKNKHLIIWTMSSTIYGFRQT